MELPKSGDTIIVKTDSEQFSEDIVEFDRPNNPLVKDEAVVTVITRQKYTYPVQYHFVFKGGIERTATLQNIVAGSVKEKVYRATFLTTFPNTKTPA